MPLPNDIRSKILAKPFQFLELLLPVLEAPRELFLLVDKTHSLSADYEPIDLVSLAESPLSISRNSHSLRLVLLPDLLDMNRSAQSENILLLISSTYRSYSYQKTVYDRNVAQLGKETADRESAQPGKSQHQLGTVIDFGSITDAYGDTPAGRWLYERAWEFGFSLSYPEGYEFLTGYRHEIWHYRYISKPATFLERTFFLSVQQYLLQFLADLGDVFRARIVKEPSV